jgi:hypothetical protein
MRIRKGPGTARVTPAVTKLLSSDKFAYGTRSQGLRGGLGAAATRRSPFRPALLQVDALTLIRPTT